MANQEHVARLREGVEAWNRWRLENSKIRPDLRSADLRGADFRGANLIEANLIEANLIEANLIEANLIEAILIEANLRGANLEGANLEGANLRGANLEGANLRGADVTNALLDDVLGLPHTKKLDLVQRGAVLRKDLPPHTNEVNVGNISLHSDVLVSGIVQYACLRGDIISCNKAFCYVHAEMYDRVIVHRVTTVEIVVSKELLDRVTSAASQGGTVKIDSDKRLIVQVIPKTNFTTIETDRVELDPPSKGKPHRLYFDLRATHLGEGEVWVVLRQKQVSLLTLVLRPTIVENRGAFRETAMAVSQSVGSSSSNNRGSSQRLQAFGRVGNLPAPSKPLHQLRIIERRNGTQLTYLYELNSPILGLLSLHESKPITSDRYDYVKNLYQEIESRWSSTQGDAEDFAEELRAFGGQLFDQLFPEQLQQQLWNHRQQLDNIMVISTEPFIPWELVHLKPPGQNHLPSETCFLGQMGLTRWLHDVGFPPKKTRIRPGDHARYVIPHYPDKRYRLPQAEQEFQFLEERFEATSVEPKPANVRQLLKDSYFDLLHFAGHGLAEQDNIANAKLMLEGRMENGKYVPAYLSATTVEQYCNCNERDRNDRPIVVLNACQIGREGYALTGIGGFAQAFLKGGAGVFVGTLWSVGDRPARIFTETLYSSLLEGMTLAEATVAARQQAKQAGNASWLAYVVYGHPHLKLKLPRKPRG